MQFDLREALEWAFDAWECLPLEQQKDILDDMFTVIDDMHAHLNGMQSAGNPSKLIEEVRKAIQEVYDSTELAKAEQF